MDKERRKFPRFDLEYAIQIISQEGDMVMTAMTSNISDGGLRAPIPSECLPNIGKEVKVNLTLRKPQTGDIETYTGLGEVIRHTIENEDGESEVVLKFRTPMALHLTDEKEPDSGKNSV